MNIQTLFKVSDNEELNDFLLGIYTNKGVDLSGYTSIIVRKAFFSNTNKLYVNQIYLGNTGLNQLVYSDGYPSKEKALSALKEFVIAEYNSKALFYAIVNWDAVETGQTVFNLSGHTLNYGNDISQNLFLVANMLKRHNLTMPLSTSEGWPLRMNCRIQCTHNTTLLNDEENMVFGTAPVFNHFAPGKENIVIKDKPLGRFCVYETTNTQYKDYNIVHQKAYNPYYEENALTIPNAQYMKISA